MNFASTYHTKYNCVDIRNNGARDWELESMSVLHLFIVGIRRHYFPEYLLVANVYLYIHEKCICNSNI